MNHLEAIVAPSAIHKLGVLARPPPPPPPPPPVRGQKLGDGKISSPAYRRGVQGGGGAPHTDSPAEVSALFGLSCLSKSCENPFSSDYLAKNGNAAGDGLLTDSPVRQF